MKDVGYLLAYLLLGLSIGTWVMIGLFSLM